MPKAPAGPPAPGGQPTTFAGLLRDAVSQANRLELQAQDLDARLALGEPVDLHKVVIASEQAALALDLVVQVRNRAIEAYQEIMRMPL
ncbi:MAG TPA: flagellar hook-basal body complex protein FliE [Clostridiales bacterium UBA8153]|nr:flagellar hook-basal body complex protein FliE [Clostridiales bacterium UBA8153]